MCDFTELLKIIVVWFRRHGLLKMLGNLRFNHGQYTDYQAIFRNFVNKFPRDFYISIRVNTITR